MFDGYETHGLVARDGPTLAEKRYYNSDHRPRWICPNFLFYCCAFRACRAGFLMALWAGKGKGISHKHIVAPMGVTRATVSGLMAALERDGLVKSQVDGEDRRKLIARLTARGEAVIKKQHELNRVKFRAAFSSVTSEELSSLTALLHRFREAFAAPAEP